MDINNTPFGSYTPAPPANNPILAPRGLGGSIVARPPMGGARQGFAGGGQRMAIQRGLTPQFQGGQGVPRMDMPRTMNPNLQGGVRPGVNTMGGPSVPSPQGPSMEQIQAEMARRNVGAQLGPRNGALAGYMMGR